MQTEEILEEKILDKLKEQNKALSAFELEQELALKKEDFTTLIKTLNKMEEQLKIYRTKKDNYMLFTNSHLKIGTLLVNKRGFGFVDVGSDEDIFIPIDSINKAIHNDQVVVEITLPYFLYILAT